MKIENTLQQILARLERLESPATTIRPTQQTKYCRWTKKGDQWSAHVMLSRINPKLATKNGKGKGPELVPFSGLSTEAMAKKRCAQMDEMIDSIVDVCLDAAEGGGE